MKLIRLTYISGVQEQPVIEWFVERDEVHADNARDAYRGKGMVIADQFDIPEDEDGLIAFLNQHAPVHPCVSLKIGR